MWCRCIFQLLLKITSSKKWNRQLSVLISRVCLTWKSNLIFSHYFWHALVVRKRYHKGPLLITCVQYKRTWQTISLGFFESHRYFSVLYCLITFLSQLLIFYGHLVLQFESSSPLLENQLVALSITTKLSASGMETSRFLGWTSIGQQWDSGDDSLLSP